MAAPHLTTARPPSSTASSPSPPPRSTTAAPRRPSYAYPSSWGSTRSACASPPRWRWRWRRPPSSSRGSPPSSLLRSSAPRGSGWRTLGLGLNRTYGRDTLPGSALYAKNVGFRIKTLNQGTQVWCCLNCSFSIYIALYIYMSDYMRIYL
jgi:hypothetical protein